MLCESGSVGNWIATCVLQESRLSVWKKDEDYVRMDGSTGAQSRKRFTTNFNDASNERWMDVTLSLPVCQPVLSTWLLVELFVCSMANLLNDRLMLWLLSLASSTAMTVSVSTKTADTIWCSSDCWMWCYCWNCVHIVENITNPLLE